MAGVNKVILLGHLGADPETRHFQSGGKVVNFRLATSETWKDKDGNSRERTEWHSVAIFNEGLGNVAEKYLRKGSQVYLEGQIETRKWQDRDGNDRFTTEVVLRPFRGSLTLIGGNQRQDGGTDGGSANRGIGGRNDAGGSQASSDTGSGGRQSEHSRRSGRDPNLDDDIPF